MNQEWAWTPNQEDKTMPLGERIKTLRKEHDWSQADLGTRIGADSQRISRYENGKLTPAITALIRLAETLNVTVDYLIIEGAPRRPLDDANTELADRIHQLGQLDPDDQQAILHILDGLITKNVVRNALQNAS
jgi:transcriptional regulator with XRE-family HTH domain